ncbi:hypothetical protein B0H14DRAFT_2358669 [Mycena olivaceomarginata]|nr:hypothetical protein B0H14DRAFT_2358669 [Mycena olivaceomarginata]
MKSEHRMPPDTLQLLTLSIRHSAHGEIGYITAIHVRRLCYGLFLEVMDVDTELFAITSAIFNKYREIRPWLVENEYHKGSGLWGQELNEGNLMIVLCVSVDAEYRKQGVASWALQQLYASQYVEKEDKILCWPSPIPRPPSDQWVTVFDGIVEFFRKIGYRRVGATSFFAYSQDAEHPSRKKSYLEDFDPDEKFSIEDDPHPRLPLHDAIFKDDSEKIVDVVENAHAHDPTSISSPDTHGFRPIFVAVEKKNIHALRALISLGLSDEDFNSRDNGDHLTPLEACSAAMCSSRDLEEILMYDGWKGYSDISLHIKATLKRAMGHPMPPTNEEYVAKKKWGCICGKCHGGWLSPRMLIRLHGEISERS